MLARVMIPFALTVATVAANPTGVLRCGQGSIIRSVTPECTWSLSGTQFAYQLQLFHISDSEAPIYATRRVESPSPRHQIPTSAGVRPGNSYILRLRYWKSADRRTGSMWSTLQFHVALLTQNDWNEAAWLGSEKLNRYRVDFNAPADAAAVHVYVCGLGYSRVTLNGGKHVLDLDIGDQVLTTAPWTNNAKTNGFTTVDITHQLRPGSNTIGVELGHGWRDQQAFPIKDPTDMPGTGSISRVVRAIVIAQLANGTSQVVTHTGDGSWQASAGPVTADSVYNGEECDGRIALQQHGWDRPQPERQETTNDWAQAPVSSAPPQGLMVPWMAPPVRIAEKISPVKIWKPKQHPDVFVVDFGVNVAGVCRIRGINGATGQIIKLRHAEILQHTGLPDLKSVVDPEMIYTGNLRGAQATDVYTLHGSGEEWYMPTQTYHGFRFVEISGSAGFVPNTTNIELVHFHSANKQRSSTNFSSSTLNQIQRMALGAQRSNMMTVPTDCDQRDERLGWMGDADLSVDSMLLNYVAGEFFGSFADTINTELGADGSLPDTVPFVRYGGRPGDVSWSAALSQIAWALYKYNNDISVAKQYWPAILQQFENVKTQAAGGMGSMHTPYGDWCPPPAKPGTGQGPKPSSPYTSAYSYAVMAQHIAEMAVALGKEGNWSTVAQDLVNDFNTAFFQSDNKTYDLGMQTDLALALSLGAPPTPELRSLLTKSLLADLKARNNHFSTGIIGLKALLPALHANGAEEVALAILEQTDYPSIGYSFANSLEPASTNLWELPDAFAEGTGMNSRNHHMYSSFSGYLVQYVAGIGQSVESAGFANARLRPASVMGLHYSNASVELQHGVLELSWQRHGGLMCAKAPQGDYTAMLDCGNDGGRIEAITYAAIGHNSQHSGLCGEFMFNSSTRAMARTTWSNTAILTAVEQICVGSQSCQLQVDDLIHSSESHQFADGEVPSLWVQAKCSKPALLRTSMSVPIGSTATLHIPAGIHSWRSPRVMLVKDKNTEPIFPAENSAPKGSGVAHATLATDHADRTEVQLALNSGQYEFIAGDAGSFE